MKNIGAIIQATESRGKAFVERVFGPSRSLADVSKACEELLPETARDLQELCKFYEREMLLCRDSNAYFSGCLAGAAMIEAFLLLFCVLDEPTVKRAKSFNVFAKKNKPYADLMAHWTLKELIPLSEELQWIGATVVEKDLVTALVDGYYEMLPMARPGITQEEMDRLAEALRKHPDVALLLLMQSMRNLAHAGRCIRLRKNLSSGDFSDWAKLIMVLTVEIRDCLILRLNSVYQQYFVGMVNSPDGVAAILKLLARLRAAEPLNQPANCQ